MNTRSLTMKSSSLPQAFQQVFFTTVFLTILSGGGSFWLSQNPKLTPNQTRIFETLNTTWNMGIGAIFGLLGGKATDLLTNQTNENK
jgi:hypothetical protein